MKDAEATFGEWKPVFKKEDEALMQVRSRSIPACNSYECKTESIVKPESDFVPYQIPKYPSEKYLNGEAQFNSISWS